ncbi:DUF3576 domain-containing protein [Pelagibacteraceae bacterium]|nr:DUF3576 domain-containing protein [Pelagibacteraceae bacterium]
MILFKSIILLIALLTLTSCNSSKSDEEMEELWSKAQTTGQIIARSGTSMNSAINKDAAMRDAETRLQTGGGLFGSEGLSVSGLLNNDSGQSKSVASIGMTLNIYLWQGALDTISFMPLNSADPIGGTIITDWYSTESNENERCKLNIFITGSELKTQNLRVASFCQQYKDAKWIGINVDAGNNVKLENAILNKAKILKLQSS